MGNKVLFTALKTIRDIFIINFFVFLADYD